jgi:hypothetical protein
MMSVRQSCVQFVLMTTLLLLLLLLLLGSLVSHVKEVHPVITPTSVFVELWKKHSRVAAASMSNPAQMSGSFRRHQPLMMTVQMGQLRIPAATVMNLQGRIAQSSAGSVQSLILRCMTS